MPGDFQRNLNKIYGIYAGGFLAFVALMAVLDNAGVSETVISYGFVGFTILIYAAIGVMSRTTMVNQYYVAGRSVPAVYNGMATAADWMSGASFVAMAGGIFFTGYGYTALLVGWTGGYVLVATLLAPYLRKFGAYTVPDFLGARYGGNMARFFGVVVLFVCSLTYVTSQINAAGTIASRAFGIPFEWAVFVGLAGILMCSMLGGMRAVTWTQVAQYIVLIFAYIMPVVWLSIVWDQGFLPQLAYGGLLKDIAELEVQHGLGGEAYATVQVCSKEVTELCTNAKTVKAITNPHWIPNTDPVALWKYSALIFCLMAGTASLPHVLMRFFTTPSVRDARISVAWSLLFIFLLYFTAPALATFAKFNFLENLVGMEAAALESLNWFARWKEVQFADFIDLNSDGIVGMGELVIRPDVVVLATPEMAGLPYWVSGLVAAGGLAAALSTADGLLLAIANALSHDVYGKILDPKASAAHRLIVARVLLIGIGILGASLAALQLTGILGGVIWAFSFAASGLFVPLVLGVWWKRANRAGALSGIAAGFISGSFYLYHLRTGGDPILHLDHLRFGIVGMVVCFVTMVVVSLMTSPPPQDIQDMVDDIRYPMGETTVSKFGKAQ
ncbi:MAG: sodium:solute symporter family protein [Gammaproteobacteria bacterium]